MVREFKLPDVGEGVAEGEIVGWLVEVGDAVTEDQPVAEVETDKAIVEVPSPVNGTVREILAEEGEVVPVGNVIITFDVEGESAEPRSAEESGAERGSAEEASAESGSAEEAGESGATEETTDTAEQEEPTDSQEQLAEEPEVSEDEGEEEAPSPGGRVFAAPSARRLARELGVDIASVEGTGPSGRVTDQDVHAAAEGGAESAASEESAEESTTGAEERDEALAEAEEPVGGASREQGTQPTTESADRDKTLAAPATRRVAREEGVDIDAVPAVEEREGEAFVTEEAVVQYAEAQRDARAAEPVEAGPREERVPYKGIRRTIGQQMERSKFTAPHVTHHDTADVTALVETREELKELADERGIRLTYMPFIMKAIVAALEEFPYLNSQLDEDAEEILLKDYYNIGIAVATDSGLMVPVVDGVDEKGMLQIASDMNELVSKARDRTISREEMQGGTFTITNFGAIGGEYATPIINHPEVAILGLGELKQRPMVVESEAQGASDSANGDSVSTGEVEARWTLPISLSIDHRVIDGAVAAEFANEVLRYLNNPKLLLLE